MSETENLEPVVNILTDLDYPKAANAIASLTTGLNKIWPQIIAAANKTTGIVFADNDKPSDRLAILHKVSNDNIHEPFAAKIDETLWNLYDYLYPNDKVQESYSFMCGVESGKIKPETTPTDGQTQSDSQTVDTVDTEQSNTVENKPATKPKRASRAKKKDIEQTFDEPIGDPDLERSKGLLLKLKKTLTRDQLILLSRDELMDLFTMN